MDIDKLSSSTYPDFTKNWNELAGAVNRLRKMRVGTGLSLAWIGGVPCISVQDQDVGLRFFNDAGSQVPAYGCMRVNAVDTATGIVKIKKPSTTFGQVYLFNNAAPIADQNFGFAQTGPVQRATYNTGSPANGDGYGPTPAQWYLTVNYPQTSVVEGVYDATNKIFNVTNLPISDFFGKPSGSISARASGTINLYGGAFGSESVISSYNVTAFNISTATAVTSSDWVVGTWVNGQAVFTKAC
jgi:hypothetical protein